MNEVLLFRRNLLDLAWRFDPVTLGKWSERFTIVLPSRVMVEGWRKFLMVELTPMCSNCKTHMKCSEGALLRCVYW